VSDEDKLDALLSKQASSVFDRSAEGPHISDERMALDPAPTWTPEELAHLSRCIECRGILADRVRETAGQVIPFRRRIVWALSLAAAVLVGLIFIVRDPALRNKGSGEALSAELTMIATSSTGARRDVRSGDKLLLTDRIGFKYGNPDGAFRTISVLGFDGQTIHWYYPERAGGAAQPIERTTAIGTRLPFDVELAGDHRPGRLKIVAGFDADPNALALMLQRGESPKNAQVIDVEVLGGVK
jgi:hypothetical protein